MTTLAPMHQEAFVEFQQNAIKGYARQNVESGRWPAERARELSRAEYQRLLPDGLSTKDAHLFEIYGPEEIPVGSLWLAVQRSTGTPAGYVFNVEIAEQYRRRGHAKRAFEALEPICRDLGLAFIALNVFAFNTPARRLYEALGYEVTAISMRKGLQRDGGV